MYLHKSGRLLLRSVEQESSEKVAFTFALPASYKSNVTTASAEAPPEGAAVPTVPASSAGGGDKSQQQLHPAADDDDGRRRLEALLPASWTQPRRQRRWRRAATPQEEAVGARVAALWRDGAGDEEARLLQVFKAVVNDAPSTSVKAGDRAEESEALGMTLLGDEAAAQGGEEHVAEGDGRVVAAVVIPNRAKGQYIRQPSANGRGCVFTLDAHTLPRLNSTQLAEAQRQQQEGGGGKAAAAAVAAAVGLGDDDGVGAGLDDDVDGEGDDDGDGVETLAAGGRSGGAAVDERLVFAEGLQGTLSSPECRMVLALESHEAVRLDWGKAYRKAVNYSIVVTLVCVMQIALLFRQLYYSRTQAAASRVSLMCIGQQAILDALLCIAHLLLCATLQPLFAAFASIAFFKLVIFSIFEIRYMFIIHQSRNSQSANAVRTIRIPLSCLNSRSRDPPTDLSPNPITITPYHRRASTASGGSSPRSTRASTPSSSSSSSSSTSSPTTSRSDAFALSVSLCLAWLLLHTPNQQRLLTYTHTYQVIIFLLYSFWVPQIVLNATKGIRHPLNRTYVVGMSAARCVSLCVYVLGLGSSVCQSVVSVVSVPPR